MSAKGKQKPWLEDNDNESLCVAKSKHICRIEDFYSPIRTQIRISITMTLKENV